MRLLGKSFKVLSSDNPDFGKVFTIVENDARSGYVFYQDQHGEDYSGKIHHIKYRIENGIWLEVK
jgi:hypothetical protein